MHLRLTPILIFLGLIAQPCTASADIVTSVYIGTAQGLDNSGYFGPADAALDNAAFIATFVFDTSVGINVTGPDQSYNSGGVISAALTIGSGTVYVAGNSSSEIYVSNGSVHRFETSSEAFDNNSGHLEYVEASFVNFEGLILPAITSVSTPLSYSGQPGDVANGRLVLGSDDILLTPSSVTITSTPEPSTWAMMILGFLGLGFMAYRKKKSALRSA